MSDLIVVLPLVPALTAAVIATGGWRKATMWLPTVSCLTVGGIGITLAVRVLQSGPITAFSGQFRVDALGALMIILIGAVGTIANTYSVAYLRTELATAATTPHRARLFGVLMQLTIAAMCVVVTADNLGVLWVAIETTTIATVLLVGHRRDRASVEASWKYLVLGSVGVATALMGTVLVYFVSRQSGGDPSTALNWSSLVERAPHLDPGALRVAMGFVIVGYGTKAGLAPLHSWLPDAYSQAPAPAAALMAGALSTMSMYALLRFKVIADIALGASYVRTLLLAAALLSLVTAASLMVTQRDYKRLLAYSSVEHMGLIALAAAIGSPLAMTAALLHMIGNGLAKSVAFSATGEMLFATGTTRIDGVRGLLHQRPFIATTLGLSLLALLGLPPFSILASELAIVRAGIADGLAWAIAIALVVMLAIFTAVLVHALNMLAGSPGGATVPSESTAHVTSLTVRVTLVSGLLVAAAIGITIWPISQLLHTAAEVLAR
ncbi:MAG: proton-conducting transporter membrane subunit [Actinomycetota bacterium]|nr:proton-conducting transporter membrane subunit [Actinomycetota bacterium]